MKVDKVLLDAPCFGLGVLSKRADLRWNRRVEDMEQLKILQDALLDAASTLRTIPTSIGGCISLVEVDLSCNLLAELPETFGNLRNLKALYLGNNGLKSLPNTLFKMCLQLSVLDLHGTAITLELLRQKIDVCVTFCEDEGYDLLPPVGT